MAAAQHDGRTIDRQPRPFRRTKGGNSSNSHGICPRMSRRASRPCRICSWADAGIGKTRLVNEMRGSSRRRRGLRIHRGLVLDFGSAKVRIRLRAVIGSLLGLSPTAGGAELSIAVERVVSAGVVKSEQVVFLHDLLDLRNPVNGRTLYDAMAHRRTPNAASKAAHRDAD